jgi:N-methylhydantoinase A
MPTITDCNLVMGHLSEDNFLGGQMRLDLVRARQAVTTKVAEPLGIDPIEAAEGIVRVIEVKMEEAIKAISTMRGHDLRDFMLLAFGGAGPVHAGRIARDLGMAGLIVPLYPGVYSAIGLIMSDVKHDYVQSKMQPMSELSPAEVNHMFARLEALAAEDLRSDGFAPEHIKIQRALDMRYTGQGYEITLPCDAETLRDGGLDGLRRLFDRQHQSMFGHMAPEQAVEVVSYRVRGLGLVPPVELPRFKPTGATLADAQRAIRRVRFDGRDFECPVYQRERLNVGLSLPGPAILDQFDCTTVIHAGQTARIDEWKNLIVTQEI